ncbi:unnamed protein product [Euphydryas editha]|uniref:Endonuclease/exonuclease/phosphatase domain-containing protein n=1 Tax=Euphydryas editha TaxID=104508 RepID=A0AAU9TRI4_EUPED|nr:unnamed protein product [Euphydryas editha]
MYNLNSMDSHLTAQELDCIQVARSGKYNIQDFINLSNGSSCNNFTVLTQNIRSIYKNFDDLQVTLAQLQYEADILILTESRINLNKHLPLLNNYTSYQTTRLQNQNDGVVVYIRNNHQAVVTDLNLSHATGLQIVTANCVFLGIYRSPSSPNAESFISSLNLHLETISHYKNVFVIGDININLIPTDTEKPHERRNRHSYLNVLSLHGLLPGHSLPTRDNACLDHVMLKLDVNLNPAFVAVINATITDHDLILLQLSNISTPKPTRRSRIIIDYDKAFQTLKSSDITFLKLHNNPENFANSLISLIQSSIQANSKLIHFTSNNRILKPWITFGALKCIRLRNNMQQKLKKDPHNIILKITYKRFRNFCTNLINRLKRRYHSDLINKSVNNPRKFWTTVNRIVQYKPPKTNNVALLNSKPQKIASVNYVNNYFVSVGANLADVLIKQSSLCGHGSVTISSYYTLSSSFVLLETDVGEVHSVLMSLDSRSAPGWDGIGTAFLKHAKDFTVPCICYLANLCFKTGVFPSALKRSIVTPVYKSGDRSDVQIWARIADFIIANFKIRLGGGRKRLESVGA